ncbi:hypothetical protein RJG79_01490 [Mycoplasmatota bacterium WC44]
MNSKSKLIFVTVLIVLSAFTILFLESRKVVKAPDVFIQYNNEVYNTIPSSYCWKSTFSGICVDTINPEDFEYDLHNSVIDAEIGDEVKVIIPRQFNQREIIVIIDETNNNGIYSISLTSKNGNDVTYHFLVQ